ncbi:hypothetical protein F2Q69_00030060 [Brassica cretica]|uniref:Uncharacterized protein n=1 Tax=Brassica cretica TaxID=69181 RepID=A0A8S9S1Y4_BRACR|nr:hypothetical protein F2Q69_00030060 [Brassica cretica]
MCIWVSDGVGVVANMFSFSLCAMWHALGLFTISGFRLPPGNPVLEFGGLGSISHLSIFYAEWLNAQIIDIEISKETYKSEVETSTIGLVDV